METGPNTKKLIKAEVEFGYTPLKVTLSDQVLEHRTHKEITAIETRCLEQYAQAQKDLDEVIGEVLQNDEETLTFAKKLATRIIQLIEVDVEISETEKVTQEIRKKMSEVGITDEKDIQERIHLAMELKKAAAISKVISHKVSKTGEVSIDSGNLSEQGYHGMSPQSIKNVLKSGNLRELLYISFRTTDKYTKDLICEPNTDHVSDRMNEINRVLMEKYGWQVDVAFAATVLEGQTPEELARHGIYKMGAYHKKGEDRVARTAEEISEFNRQRVKPLKTVNLSDREKLVYTSEVPQRVSTEQNEKPITWSSGGAVWKKKENSDNPYSQAANASQQPFVASVSGTTDRTLTQAILLGCGSQEDLINCRKACLGWLISGQNHSADEILTASKSFNLPYTPGPESFQQIDPGNDQFEKAIVAKLKEKGKELPAYYLSEENSNKVEKELLTPIRPKLGKN